MRQSITQTLISHYCKLFRTRTTLFSKGEPKGVQIVNDFSARCGDQLARCLFGFVLLCCCELTRQQDENAGSALSARKAETASIRRRKRLLLYSTHSCCYFKTYSTKRGVEGKKTKEPRPKVSISMNIRATETADPSFFSEKSAWNNCTQYWVGKKLRILRYLQICHLLNGYI